MTNRNYKVSDRHMVFTVHHGHVSFQANYSHHGGPVNLSGSEPLTWYGVQTGERISEISANDMITHLLSVFEPTTSETLFDDEVLHPDWEQSNETF